MGGGRGMECGVIGTWGEGRMWKKRFFTPPPR